MMKYSELTKKPKDELLKMIEEHSVELMKYRAQAATGAPGKESGNIARIKREIARIKMALGGRDER